MKAARVVASFVRAALTIPVMLLSVKVFVLALAVCLSSVSAQPAPRLTANFPNGADRYFRFTHNDLPDEAGSEMTWTAWVSLDPTAGAGVSSGESRSFLSVMDAATGVDSGASMGVAWTSELASISSPTNAALATSLVPDYIDEEMFVIVRFYDDGGDKVSLSVFHTLPQAQDSAVGLLEAASQPVFPAVTTPEVVIGSSRGLGSNKLPWFGNITMATVYGGAITDRQLADIIEHRHRPGGVNIDGVTRKYYTPIAVSPAVTGWRMALDPNTPVSPNESQDGGVEYLELDLGIDSIEEMEGGKVSGARKATLMGDFRFCDILDLKCDWGYQSTDATFVTAGEIECKVPNPDEDAEVATVVQLKDSAGKFGRSLQVTVVPGFDWVAWIEQNPILAAAGLFVVVVSLFCVAACTCCKPPVTYSEVVEIDEEGLPKDVRETQDFRKSLRAMMSLSIRSDVFNLSMPLFESIAPALTIAQEERAKLVGKKLFPLFMENDYALLQALCKSLHFDRGNPQPQISNVAESVIILMETRRQALPLLKILLAQEVEAAATPLTLFHKRPGESEAQGHFHSVVVQMINTYAKLISLDFIRKVLQKSVTSITGAPAPKDQNVRASIMSMASGTSSTSLASIMEEDREGYGLQLQGEKLLRNLVARGNPPPQLREIAAVLNYEGVRKFGGSPVVTQQLVGQAFFTRFLLTAMINPVKYGLAAKEPSDTGQRDLILLAKTVQKLVNGQRFEGNEGYMAPLNEFLDDYQEMIQEYCMTFGTVPRDNRHLKARFPKHGPESAALNLHALLVRHLPAMKKSGMPLPSNVDAVLNDLGKPVGAPGDALASMTNNTEINLPENVAGTLIPSIEAAPHTPKPPNQRRKLGGKKVAITQGKVTVGANPNNRPGSAAVAGGKPAGGRGSAAVTKGGPAGAGKSGKGGKKEGGRAASHSKASDGKGGKERKKSAPRKLSKARPSNPPPAQLSTPKK